MALVDVYRDAQRDEEVARLRRVITIRAMLASDMSQRQVAEALGISQPAVSQQLRHSPDLKAVHPELLLDAATPVLKELATERGYSRLAVFGSVAREQAGPISDIDLLVEAPYGTSSFGFVRFKLLVEEVLGREIDLVSHEGLDPDPHFDIRRDIVML